MSKCDQNGSFLQIWSHLLKKSLMENLIFCAVNVMKVIYKCFFHLFVYYHFFSNKYPQRLSNFKVLRCGAYWRRPLFQGKNYSNEILKFHDCLLPNHNKYLTLRYSFAHSIISSYFHCLFADLFYSLFPLTSLIYVEKFGFENPAIMEDKQCKQTKRFSNNI